MYPFPLVELLSDRPDSLSSLATMHTERYKGWPTRRLSSSEHPGSLFQHSPCSVLQTLQWRSHPFFLLLHSLLSLLQPPPTKLAFAPTALTSRTRRAVLSFLYVSAAVVTLGISDHQGTSLRKSFSRRFSRTSVVKTLMRLFV